MQVEVKFVLEGVRDYDTLCSTWQREKVHSQTEVEDHFFDGPAGELIANDHTILRLRFVSQKCEGVVDERWTKTSGERASRAFLTFKEGACCQEGSSMRWSMSVDLPLSLARTLIQPKEDVIHILSSIPEADSLVDAIRNKHSIKALNHIGNFSTSRITYNWPIAKSQPGLTLHLDRTVYPFGESFEIEVPNITVPVQDVINELSAVLNGLQIHFRMGEESKFQHFVRGVRELKGCALLEQQVKVVLFSLGDYEAAENCLRPNFQARNSQANFYFDGLDDELSHKDAFLRVRCMVQEEDRETILSAVVSLKEHSKVIDATATRWSEQWSLPVEAASIICYENNPNALLLVHSPIPMALRDKYNVHSLKKVGCFVTLRSSYNWPTAKSQPGLTLHLDRTVYPFGESYEIEVPNITVPVQDVINELSAMLNGLQIHFRMGEESKFQHFVRGVLEKKETTCEVKGPVTKKARVNYVAAN